MEGIKSFFLLDSLLHRGAVTWTLDADNPESLVEELNNVVLEESENSTSDKNLIYYCFFTAGIEEQGFQERKFLKSLW